jgi:hypothetical protein
VIEELVSSPQEAARRNRAAVKGHDRKWFGVRMMGLLGVPSFNLLVKRLNQRRKSERSAGDA